MGVFFEQEVNEKYKLAVFEINETENELIRSVNGLKQPFELNNKSEKRRLEILANHRLLISLTGTYNYELKYEESGKPYLIIDEKVLQISLSHSGNYVAALISNSEYYGVDIQVIKNKIIRLDEKFLNQTELEWTRRTHTRNQAQILTTCWCAKETLYKMYGKGFIDFQNQFHIQEFSGPLPVQIQTKAVFESMEHEFTLHAKYWPDLVLVYYS